MELTKAKSVYIDSNCLIYYFEGNTKKAKSVEELFNLSIQNNIKLLTAELTYLELLVLPIKTKQLKIVNLYKNLHKHIPNLSFVEVNKKVFINAAKIRANYNYKSPDSIHLATAINNKCDFFITADKKLKSFKKIKVKVI